MTAQPRGLGDNKGPSLVDLYFIDWVMGVLFSDMEPIAKLVTLAAVILQTANSVDLAKAINTSHKSIERHKAEPARKGWLHIPPSAARRGGRSTRYEFLPGHPDHKIPVNLTGVNWSRYRPILDATNALNDGHRGEPCDKTPDKLGVVNEETPVNLSDKNDLNPRQSVRHDPLLYFTTTTTTTTQGAVTTDLKALAEAAEALKDRLLKDDQHNVIANPAAYPGLDNASEIMAWLQGGADPYADIIPTIQRTLKRLRYKNSRQQVTTWRYFTKAIFEAKATRENCPPPPSGVKGANGRQVPKTYVTEPDGDDDLLGGGR
jgi:hypothetical protein